MTPHPLHSNPDQDWLLPPSVADWLPKDHLAWVLLDAVGQMDLSAFASPTRPEAGGRPPYDPKRMVCLLLYAYCVGERYSRRIERRCYEDVAMRVVSANATPDHATIARFRKDHEDAFKALFCQVLRLCREVGLGKVGVVAIDGTKMGANASLAANASPEAIDKAIEAEVTRILADVASADAGSGEDQGRLIEPQASPSPLPPALADPAVRQALLAAASKAIAASRKAEIQAPQGPRGNASSGGGASPVAGSPTPAPTDGPPAVDDRLVRAIAEPTSKLSRLLSAKAQLPEQGGGAKQADYDNKQARRQAHIEATGKAPRGRPPKAPDPEAVRSRANVTDPDSRIMKTIRGWVQGYNAQALVSEDQIVLACLLTQDRNDIDQLHPVLREASANLVEAGFSETIAAVLADAGYCSEDNLARADPQGPQLYVATEKGWKQRPDETGPSDPEVPEPEASLVEDMAAKLKTDEGKALYKKRGQTVEPVFGQTKEGRGIRHFVRRGFAPCESEWALINISHNVLKYWRATTGQLRMGAAQPEAGAAPAT